MDAPISFESTGWRKRLLVWLQSPKMVPLSIVLALLLCVPSLWMGLFGDDHYHRIRFVAPQVMPAKTDLSLFGLFTVASGAEQARDYLVSHALMPWFVQEGFRFQPWRPLVELSHAVDYLLWPSHPWLMHLHQLLWIGVFFFSVRLFYRDLFGAGSLLSVLATVLVVLDANMAQTHYWLAGRNTIIAASFSLLCLFFYRTADQEKSIKKLILSLVCFSIAMFTSELTLGAVAYLFSYACFMQTGSLLRFIRLLPFAVVSFIWLLCYKLGHQGVAGSDWYFDPLNDPSGFLQALGFRFPKAVFQQFFILPLEIFGKVSLGSFAWIAGCVLLAVMAFGLRKFLLSNTQRYLVLGALLSIVPLCAGPGIPRALLLVSVGLLPLMAEFVLQYLTSVKNGFARQLLFWPFFSLHVLGILAIPLVGFVFSISDVINVQTPARSLPVAEEDFRKQWINLNVTSAMHAMLYPLVRGGEHLGLPQNWYLTGAGAGEVAVKVLSDHSLELSSENAFLGTNADYFLRKKSTPFKINEVYHFTGMDITLLALTEDNRPKQVRFDFSRPLSEDSSVLFACQGQKIIRLTLNELAAMQHLRCGR